MGTRKIPFVNGEFYHVYNRGVDKRVVFSDDFDMQRFFQSIEEFNVVEPIGSIYENSFIKNKGEVSNVNKLTWTSDVQVSWEPGTQVCRYLALFVFGMFFLSTSSAFAATLHKPPNNLGLVGYYPMNEGTGTIAGDFSGNGNTGTLVSSPTWVTGKLGQALSFNGSNTVSIPNSSSLSPTASITLSAWVSPVGSGIFKTIIGKGADKTYEIDTGGGTNSVRFVLMNSVPHAFVNFTVSNILPLNQWTLVTATYDGSVAHLYANGVLVGSQSVVDTIAATTYPVTIASGDNFFNSTIDDVRIYSRALSSAEIAYLYQSGFAKLNSSHNTQVTNGIVGLWSFDGPDMSGTTAYDRSGQGNTGTLSGTTLPTPTIGKLGQGLSFDGVSGYVNVSGAILPSNNLFSISLWFKTTSNGVLFSEQNNSIGSIPSSYDPILYIETTGKLHGGIYTGSVAPLESIAAVNDGKWHSVVMVVNKPNSSQSLYVDGTFVGTGSGNPEGPFWYVYMGTGYTNYWPNTNNTWFYFNGSIDDVRVYNRALTQADITQLYNMGGSKINSSQNNIPGSTLSSGLVGLWSFNGPDMSGTTAYDRSGNANNGTLTNGPTPTIGKVGQALSFDGSSGYVNLPNSMIQPYTTVSASGWFKTSGDGVILGYQNTALSGAPSAYVPILYVGLDGKLRGEFWMGAVASITTVGSVNDNTWHHVVLVGNVNTQSMYLDGVLVGTLLGGINHLSMINNQIGVGYGGGGWLGTSGGWFYFNGSIDEVRLYNRALSPNEVKQLYLLGR